MWLRVVSVVYRVWVGCLVLMSVYGSEVIFLVFMLSFWGLWFWFGLVFVYGVFVYCLLGFVMGFLS